MQFSVSQSELSQAIALASRAVSSRPTHPILGYLLIEAKKDVVTVTGFDLSLGIRLTVPATVVNVGAVTVPATLFNNIVSRLTGDLTITVGEDASGFLTRTLITSDSGRFELGGLDYQEFPSLPTVDGDAVTLPSDVLLEGIRGTVFCASTDETKQVLTGVHIRSGVSGLEFAATDGHRLAVVTVPCDHVPELQVTLPSRALKELEKLIGSSPDITLYADDVQAVFEVGDRRLVCRKLDGAYPAYQQLIPKQFSRLVTVDRRRLISGLERVAVLADEKNNLVTFDVNNEDLSLEVSGAEIGNGRDRVPCELTGNEFRIAFNIVYVLNGLKAIQSQSVTLQCNEPNQPSVIVPLGASKMLYLVMPVMIR